MNDFIPVNTPRLDGNELAYLEECINTGWISSEGPFVKRLEKEFKSLCNRSYALAVSSGTAALDSAITALDLGRGDEIIVPSFTIISCAAQIVRTGAIPVVVDTNPETLNMDVLQIEEQITGKTRAIMAVHTYGLPVDMDPLLEIATKHNLLVIEDAAQAHGQEYKNRPCGSFGDISIFSFYTNKHVTTGEGGMILTDDPELAAKVASLRNLCFQEEKRFFHDELGWNMRLSNLQAAVGVAQVERLNEWISIKKRMGALYSSKLKDTKGIKLPLSKTSFAENHYWVYGLILNRETGISAEIAMKYLAKQGIGTRPFFWPLHKQPVFLKKGLFQGTSCPVAENLAEYGFYIPSGLSLTDSQITRVCRAVKKMIKEC